MSEALQERELPPEVRMAIRDCAKDIIGTEATCIEWGVEAHRSVEMAEESITSLVKKLQFSGQITTYTIEAKA
jgi:hypothetical protein